MPEITEAAVVGAVGSAIAGNSDAMTAIKDAAFGTVQTAADSAATRYVPVTIDGTDYLILAKLAP